MLFQFHTIGIIGLQKNPLVTKTIQHIQEKLFEHNLTTIVENQTAKKLINKNSFIIQGLTEIAKLVDLVVIVGGDGFFLKTSKALSMLRKNIPIVGINRGKLGFLASINPNQIGDVLLSILQGSYIPEQRFLLQAQVNKKILHALNDIVITTRKYNKLFHMQVKINGEYAFDQRSDGIIIATPTGSTAHSLSAGGPILDPKLNGIVLVPIFSHSLNNRPIIVNSGSNIDITIGSYNLPRPMLIFDGHRKLELRAKDTIKIYRSKKEIKILYPSNYDYFYLLRKKAKLGNNAVYIKYLDNSKITKSV